MNKEYLDKLEKMLEENFTIMKDEIYNLNVQIFEKNKEIIRLNTLIDKYVNELTCKTEQYEYLRHYHNLSSMKQYPIKRELFCEIFGKIELEFYDELYDITTTSFKCWRYDDEFYILHLDSGTLINWYKHLGRCNTCNKELSVEDYKKLADDLYNELKGSD